jgi:uroporphyrinogen decarboxylase
MDSLERVLTALQHREPDRIPLDLGSSFVTGMTKHAYLCLAEALGERPGELELYDVIQQLPVMKESILEKLGVDIRGVVPNVARKLPALKRDGDGFVFTDEFGLTYRKNDDTNYFSVIHSKLGGRDISIGDIEEFDWPDPQSPKLFEGIVDQARSFHQQGYAVLLESICAGLFEMSCRIRGTEQFYMDLSINPELACAVLDKCLDLKVRFYEAAAGLLGHFVQFIREGDDVAGQEGMLISPRMYRELIKPRHKKLFDAQKRFFPKPFFCFLHSDGAIMQILPDFIESGVEILNPVQASASGMDLRTLKARYGDSLSFWGGGVDTQHVLPHARPDEVKKAVTDSIDSLSVGGGFVFGAVHNIQDDVPAENAIAMMEAFCSKREYGNAGS